MKICLFCDNAAGSREHLFPEWILKRVPRALIRGDVGHHKDKTFGYEFTVKSVCSSCNTGWMHRLEHETIPMMAPMLSERPSFLDVVSQRTIAAWTLKTAMVLDSATIAKHRPLFYSRAERIALRESLRIPSRTFVWLGRSLELGLAAYSTGTYFTLLNPCHPYSLKESPLGQVSTILVRNLAIQPATLLCGIMDGRAGRSYGHLPNVAASAFTKIKGVDPDDLGHGGGTRKLRWRQQ
jgi:hypothetical protein